MRAMAQRTTSRDRKAAAPRVLPMVTLLYLDSWRCEHVSFLENGGSSIARRLLAKITGGMAKGSHATFLLADWLRQLSHPSPATQMGKMHRHQCWFPTATTISSTFPF